MANLLVPETTGTPPSLKMNKSMKIPKHVLLEVDIKLLFLDFSSFISLSGSGASRDCKKNLRNHTWPSGDINPIPGISYQEGRTYSKALNGSCGRE